MKRNRLTNNDINIGPITIGEPDKHWRPIGITLESGCEEYPGCSLNLYTGWRTIRLALPQIIKPWRRWVDCSRYSWADGPNSGYWDVHRREYGFRLFDGFLQVFLGQQTHDSTTTKDWCTHLPWTQWRVVWHSMYGLQGEHFWSESTKARRDWDDWHKACESCPTANFLIEDYDGARIVAKTRIEEREYRLGERWCSWLGNLRRPRLYRHLMIDFSAEVGTDKGSWKGGMMGHSIDMLPGELHESAFRRYCEQDVRNKYGTSRITFLGVA